MVSLQDDPRWNLADPICTFLFAFLVLLTTRAILRDISDILMERVPRAHDASTIQDGLEQVSHPRHRSARWGKPLSRIVRNEQHWNKKKMHAGVALPVESLLADQSRGSVVLSSAERKGMQDVLPAGAECKALFGRLTESKRCTTCMCGL